MNRMTLACVLAISVTVVAVAAPKISGADLRSWFLGSVLGYRCAAVTCHGSAYYD